MPLTFEEMTRVAIQNQRIILNEELKTGVPLNYRDEQGRDVLEYPDGHIEVTEEVMPLCFLRSEPTCRRD